VDATQGVQSQTMANFFLAFDAGLEIIPVLNKIDVPSADLEKCLTELQETFGTPPEEVFQVSAKLGDGMDAVLPAIINRIPK